MIRHLFAAAAALAAAQAIASGYDATPNFANTSTTDLTLARYQAGELGILRPTYERVYLYAAWRAIALGQQGLKKAPNPDQALNRALGNRFGGWSGIGEGDAIRAWSEQIDSALGKGMDREAPAKPLSYINCPAASYSFAAATLAGLAKRKDATPARLQAWIRAQRQVFKFCGDDPDNPRGWDNTKKVDIPMPSELPASEPLHWRQVQQYQLAAAAFHDNQFVLSGQRFAQIGATAGHPLRDWGAYLALRSAARAGASGKLDAAAATAAMASIATAADAILADSTLSARHEDSRAVVRAARAAITPQARFAELSALLDRPDANPYLDDYLGDWRVIANHLDVDGIEPFRKSAGFVDWIMTMRFCGEEACKDSPAHALQMWQRAVDGRDAVQARVWLVAAAMLAPGMTPALEKAALKVAPGAPEYLTVRHALQRHYRSSGANDKARAIGDALLASAELRRSESTSARNLVTAERFAAANSLDDAAGFLVRTQIMERDADTGEGMPAQHRTPDQDGMHWLNGALSVASLHTLSLHPRIEQPVRVRIAIAAWMRADLLGDAGTALKAAGTVEKLAPQLAEAMRNYQNLAPAARHDWMLLSALRHGLAPNFTEAGIDVYKLRDKGETRTDMWCKVTRMYESDQEPNRPKLAPVLPDATAPAEVAALDKVKNATSYYGDFVLARADAVPKDPELPWLLHVVVKSTRGGCLDQDASALSKKAFGLLHKRFKGNEWARKTPYHY